MIHVCFGLYDNKGSYSKFTGTTMLSMFENTTSNVTVHILHDNTFTPDNRDKFIYLAGQYGQLVKFYNVEKLCADRVEEFQNLLTFVNDPTRTLGTLYKFLIPHVLSKEIHKTVYLDSDVVVNLDIKELWQIELGNKPLAAVPEVLNKVSTNPLHYLCREGFVKPEDFFNAGIFLMNLERLRKEDDTLKNGIKFRASHKKCDGSDNPVWCYCFSTQTVKLPLKFNVLVEYARKNNDFETTDRICHYCTSLRGKGYTLDISDPYNRLWMKYFVKTPWFDEDTFGKLYAGFQRIHISLKQSMANISAIMSGKTRAFFVAPNSIDAIKNIFSVRDDEEIIPAENNESLKKLLDAMNASRGKKVFFIMINKFPFGLLVQEGFEPGRDFVNGMEFLSEAHGVSLNSYPLIEAM